MMQLRRFEFDGRSEEKGGQQFVSGRAYYGDALTRIHRIEPHGFASSPPKGAKGLLVSTDPDFAFVLGLEHPGHRPSDLPAGATALYDGSGNIIKLLMGDGVLIDVMGSGFQVRKGGVTLTVSGSGVAIVGNVTVQGNLNATGTITDGDGDGGA